MAKLKVTLGIGFANIRQEDEIEVDDEELDKCETEQEKLDLLEEYWKDWSNNYIDGGFELIDD